MQILEIERPLCWLAVEYLWFLSTWGIVIRPIERVLIGGKNCSCFTNQISLYQISLRFWSNSSCSQNYFGVHIKIVVNNTVKFWYFLEKNVVLKSTFSLQLAIFKLWCIKILIWLKKMGVPMLDFEQNAFETGVCTWAVVRPLVVVSDICPAGLHFL